MSLATIQKSLIAYLRTQTQLPKVTDFVDKDLAAPFITLGDLALELPNESKNTVVYDASFDLFVVTESKSRGECLEICDNLFDVIHRKEFPVDGHYLIYAVIDRTEAGESEDGEHFLARVEMTMGLQKT